MTQILSSIFILLLIKSLVLVLPVFGDDSLTWKLKLVGDKTSNIAVDKDEEVKFLYSLQDSSEVDDSISQAQAYSKAKYPSLFKLDADILKSQDDSGASGEDVAEKRASSSFRQPRKFNLLGGFQLKPRASPLYLLNGTLCRFINAIPICTTLTTTGILTPTSQALQSQSSGGGSANRPQSSGLNQGQGSSVQFVNARSSKLPFVSPLMAHDRSSVNVGIKKPVTAPIFHSSLVNRNASLPLFDGLLRKKLFLINKRQGKWNAFANMNNNNGTAPMMMNQTLPLNQPNNNSQMMNNMNNPQQNQMQNQQMNQPTRQN